MTAANGTRMILDLPVARRRVSRSCMCLLLVATALLIPHALFAQASSPAPAPRDAALDLLHGAKALYGRKLYKLAGEEYQKFIEQHPAHAQLGEARFGRALCHYALDEIAQAKALFKVIAADPAHLNQQEAGNYLGQCYLSSREYAEAEKAFLANTAPTTSEPHRSMAQAGLIECLYRQRKWSDLVTQATDFLLRNAGSEHAPRIRFQCGIAHFELGRYADALATLGAIELEKETPGVAQHVVFVMAECHRELGNTDKALALFERVARNMTGSFNAEALFRLGFLRFKAEQHAAALEDFRALLRDHPGYAGSDRARLYLGRCHLARKEHALAEQVLGQVVTTSEAYSEARLWLARSHAARKDHAGAEGIVVQALQHSPDESETGELLFELASACMEQGRFEPAALNFAGAAARLRDDAVTEEARWFEAWCLHRAGQYAESAQRCATCLSARPTSTRCLDFRYLAAENAFLRDDHTGNQPTAAEHLYRDYLSSAGKHRFARFASFRIAQCLYRRKLWAEALRELDTAVKPEPGQSFFNQADFVRGDCLFQLGRWADACAALRRFTADFSDEANVDHALFTLALATERGGDKAGALAQLAAFIERHAKSAWLPNALIELGRLRYEAGDYASARKALERAAALAQSPWASFYLGAVAVAEGRSVDATRVFSQLLSAYPDHELAADAMFQLGTLELQAGRYPQAIQRLEAFLQQHARHARIYEARFALGVAYARSERWAEAERELVVLRDSDAAQALHDRVLYELAWCMRKTQRPGEARRSYEQLLDAFPASILAHDASIELCELLYDEKAYSSAIRHLEPLLAARLQPEQREQALARMGWCQLAINAHAPAATAFESLLKEFPNSTQALSAHYQAGECRLALREYPAAFRHFESASRFADQGGYGEQILIRTGECAGLAGRWQEALEAYTRFERAWPASAHLNQALFGKGWALENLARLEDAMLAYRRVIDRGAFDESTARSQFQIGECLYTQKKYDEAIKAFVLVDALYDWPEWSAKALVEAGRAHEQRGESTQARERFEEVLKKYPASDAATMAKQKLETLKAQSR